MSGGEMGEGGERGCMPGTDEKDGGMLLWMLRMLRVDAEMKRRMRRMWMKDEKGKI